MRGFVLGVGVIGLAVTCPASTANADKDEAFTQAFRAGVAAYQLGRYGEARQAFGKARRLRPTAAGPARYLARIARAQKRFQRCVEHARRAVVIEAVGPNATAMLTLHEACRRLWGRPKFDGAYRKGGALSIESDLSASSVFIDGLKVGTTPFRPRILAAGKHVVEIERKGYLPKKGTVTIVPGLVTDVWIVLKPDPNAPPPMYTSQITLSSWSTQAERNDR